VAGVAEQALAGMLSFALAAGVIVGAIGEGVLEGAIVRTCLFVSVALYASATIC
jgi:hypothetical protein